MSKLMQKSIRDAATLIIVARNTFDVPYMQQKSRKNFPTRNESNHSKDFNLLMLQRHPKSSFMPDAYVFPGGVIDKADYSDHWMEIYNDFGYSEQELNRFSCISGPRPEMFGKYNSTAVIPDVSFRICAIREAFEECGLMLFKSATNENNVLKMNCEEIFSWRQKVHENAFAFLELCRKYNLLPDIWLLREWSNWLTPTAMAPKRFDTMFYICVIDHLPFIKHDEKETTNAIWKTPNQLIVEHVNEKIWLAPPQFYEISRFMRFHNLEELDEFSFKREVNGLRQFLPVRVKLSNGIVSLLPGDDKYGATISLAERSKAEQSGGSLYEVEQSDVSLDEFSHGIRNLNRFELRARANYKLVCNQEMFGHCCINLSSKDYLDNEIDSSQL